MTVELFLYRMITLQRHLYPLAANPTDVPQAPTFLSLSSPVMPQFVWNPEFPISTVKIMDMCPK